MSNRLSWAFSRPPCRCQLIRRRLRKLAVECNTLEKIAGCFEFVVPSADAYRKGKREVRMFVDLSVDPAKVGDDLRAYAAAELRKLVGVINGAADRLESGVTP